MKQWESLFFNIKNIEEFNTRHVHFLLELKKIFNIGICNIDEFLILSKLNLKIEVA